jgi:hypothetical protein
MIAVFVGYKDGLNLFHGKVEAFHTYFGLPAGDTGIN